MSSSLPRLDLGLVAPGAEQALGALDTYVAELGLDPALLELVRVRASQINGCPLCLAMHSRDARARGESERRLYVLSAWREAALYTARERAALAWTEALTLVADSRAPDSVFQEVRAQLSEQEVAALTLAVIAINGWNRLAVGLRMTGAASEVPTDGAAAAVAA